MSGGVGSWPGHVSPAGEEAGDRDVFIEAIPMQAGRADFDQSPIGGRAVQEAREPGERDAEGAAVIQIDPE